MPARPMKNIRVVVIGGGPAGLMAAEVVAAAGVQVDVYDAMPSLGRKFLLAGVGGMNITHAEPAVDFVTRFGERAGEVGAWLSRFAADDLRAWVHALGIETFVGSSQRVFPRDMKAAPLLRAWLQRLRACGVRFHPRHRFCGFDDQGRVRVMQADHEQVLQAQAVVLALGGGSWPRLGSDATWLPHLAAQGVQIAPLRPANCGFEFDGSDYLRQHFAGHPLKTVRALHVDAQGRRHERDGECVLTAWGLEGSLIYALSAVLRDSITATGSALLQLDLMPHRHEQDIVQALLRPRGKNSLSNHWRKTLGLEGVKAALLFEVLDSAQRQQADVVAATLKALPLLLLRPRPLAEAISTAGGVCFSALDTETLMLRAMPGVFCAGEMLDWEAPTGGYLLTACMASGRWAGQGVLRWLEEQAEND